MTKNSDRKFKRDDNIRLNIEVDVQKYYHDNRKNFANLKLFWSFSFREKNYCVFLVLISDEKKILGLIVLK